MGTNNEAKNLKKEILLLSIDKIFFGLAIAIVGYYFSQRLQENQAVTDYQQILFEKRFEGYSKVLQSSKIVFDDARIFYGYEHRIKNNDEFYFSLRKLDRIKSKLSGGSSSSYRTPGDLISSIDSLQQIRTEYKIYLSDAVNNSIDSYLTIIINDLEAVIKKQKVDKTFNNEAVSKIQFAYTKLEELILKSVKMNELVLG